MPINHLGLNAHHLKKPNFSNAFANSHIRLKLGEKNYVINTLIVYSYTVKKNSTKKLLWACFGKEMVENLKVNTANLGKICPICGRRFKPFHSGDIDVYCSQECYAIGKKEYDREYRRKSCNY